MVPGCAKRLNQASRRNKAYTHQADSLALLYLMVKVGPSTSQEDPMSGTFRARRKAAWKCLHAWKEVRIEHLAGSSRQKLGAHRQPPLNNLLPWVAQRIGFVAAFAVTSDTRTDHARADPTGLMLPCGTIVHTTSSHKVHPTMVPGKSPECSGAACFGG
jgi:hypothetical protein